MMHISDGILQAYLDGELTAPERGEITRHLGECVVCSRELAVLQQAATELSRALRALDVAAPPVPARSWASVQASSLPSPRATPRRPVQLGGWGLLKAAVLVLVAGGVLAAVVPGSPLFGWPAAVWERVLATVREEAPEPVTAVSPTPSAEPGYASILPSDGRVRILLDARIAAVPIQVKWVDEARAFIEVAGDPADHAFSSGEGWLELVGSGSQITVGLPRGVAEASVEVGGRVYFRKLGDDVQSTAPVTISGGGAEFNFAPQR